MQLHVLTNSFLWEQGQTAASISPETVQSRIQALHAENVRLASEQASFASRQTTAASTEKQLQAEVVGVYHPPNRTPPLQLTAAGLYVMVEMSLRALP